MTGAGNDFIIIDNRFFRFSDNELSALARTQCTRRSAVGADGLLALAESTDPSLQFRMVYYNADGSRGTMCGNGARCLARFAVMAGVEGPHVRFETDAGPHHAVVPEDPSGTVRLFLPPFRDFRPGCTPSAGRDIMPDEVDFIWTGTEHIVLFVDDVDRYPVGDLGNMLRNDTQISAAGANVNFVEVVSSGKEGAAKIRVRTYEKGVESETDACGTGAVASAMVCCIKGVTTGLTTEVEMNGGTLTVSYAGTASNPEEIVLEGPADVVYRGSLEWPLD